MNGSPELWVTASVGEPLTFPLMTLLHPSEQGPLAGDPGHRVMNGAPELWATRMCSVAAGIEDGFAGEKDAGDGAVAGAFGLADEFDGAAVFAEDTLRDP